MSAERASRFRPGARFRNTSGTVILGQFVPGEVVTFDHTDAKGEHVFTGEERPERGGHVPAAALTAEQAGAYLEAVPDGE